jgi:hypothetical protein
MPGTTTGESLIALNRWWATRVGAFADGLRRIREGDATALDNSLLLWGNELWLGNSHSCDGMGFVLVGRAGGRIRSGRMLTYGGRTHNDLLLSILAAFDQPQPTFGDPKLCRGPLEGLM